MLMIPFFALKKKHKQKIPTQIHWFLIAAILRRFFSDRHLKRLKREKEDAKTVFVYET